MIKVTKVHQNSLSYLGGSTCGKILKRHFIDSVINILELSLS